MIINHVSFLFNTQQKGSTWMGKKHTGLSRKATPQTHSWTRLSHPCYRASAPPLVHPSLLGLIFHSGLPVEEPALFHHVPNKSPCWKLGRFARNPHKETKKVIKRKHATLVTTKSWKSLQQETRILAAMEVALDSDFKGMGVGSFLANSATGGSQSLLSLESPFTWSGELRGSIHRDSRLPHYESRASMPLPATNEPLKSAIWHRKGKLKFS